MKPRFGKWAAIAHIVDDRHRTIRYCVIMAVKFAGRVVAGWLIWRAGALAHMVHMLAAVYSHVGHR